MPIKIATPKVPYLSTASCIFFLGRSTILVYNLWIQLTLKKMCIILSRKKYNIGPKSMFVITHIRKTVDQCKFVLKMPYNIDALNSRNGIRVSRIKINTGLFAANEAMSGIEYLFITITIYTLCF